METSIAGPQRQIWRCGEIGLLLCACAMETPQAKGVAGISATRLRSVLVKMPQRATCAGV
jgi:hypothetical protein